MKHWWWVAWAAWTVPDLLFFHPAIPEDLTVAFFCLALSFVEEAKDEPPTAPPRYRYR